MSTSDSGVPFCDLDAMKWNYFGGAKPKRKLPMDEELCEDLPAFKVLLTEEKMANQLRGLHLSSSYTSHGAGTSATTAAATVDPLSASEVANTCLQPASSKKDAEDWFAPSSSRNGLPVLTICEEIKALQNKTLPLLPHGFVDAQRPTKALVLWQPPVDDIGRILSSVSANNCSNLSSSTSASADQRIDDDDIDHPPKAIETQTPAPSLDDLTSMTDAEMDNNNSASYCFFPHADFSR